MLKLNKISLEGYKSIRQCRDMRLEKLNVLIGANGSGKSNFLSFFKLLNFEMTGALQEFIGRNGGEIPCCISEPRRLITSTRNWKWPLPWGPIATR